MVPIIAKNATIITAIGMVTTSPPALVTSKIGPNTPTKRTAIHIAAMAKAAQKYLFCISSPSFLVDLSADDIVMALGCQWVGKAFYSRINSINPTIAAPAIAAPKKKVAAGLIASHNSPAVTLASSRLSPIDP